MWLKTTVGISRPRFKTFIDHNGDPDYEEVGQEDLEATVEGDVVERNGELVVLGFRSDEDLTKAQREDAETALLDEYGRALKVQTSARLVDGFQRAVDAYNKALERGDQQRCTELVQKMAQVAA